MAKFFKSIGSMLFGGGATAATPLPDATVDNAASMQSADDELLRRRGSAADILTGNRGAEAAASQVGKLVVGN